MILLLIVSDVKQKYAYISLIFFNYLDLQIIKLNMLYEIVLIKTGFGMTLEFLNRGFQPDWFSQIKLIADFIKGMKDFVCACVIAFIADDSIP